MDKQALRRVGMATMSGIPDSKIAQDPARYFHIALAAMRAAHQAATNPGAPNDPE